MSKQAYARPTVLKLGPVVGKTEGFFIGFIMELMSLRP
jgi:hypothetical protein